MGDSTQEPGPGQSVPAGREPYQKPAVAWEERLEVRPNLMAACGKAVLEGGACTGSESS